MYKTYNSNNIDINKSAYDIFNYDISATSKDAYISTTSIGVRVYNCDNGSYIYDNVMNNYYFGKTEIISTNTLIVPTARAYTNETVNNPYNITVITFDKSLYKDGISNIKPSDNINIVCNSTINDSVMGGIGVYGFYGFNDSESILYTLYDVRESATSGLVYIKVNLKKTYTSTVPNTIGWNIPIGRIIYSDSIIIIDSFVKWVEYIYVDTPNISKSYIPYCIGGAEIFVPHWPSSTDGSISANDDSHFSFYNYIDNGFNGLEDINYFIIDKINVDFILYRNLYTLNVNLNNDEFNYSENKIKNLNIRFPKEAIDKDPVYFTKVGFYDKNNNLLGIGKVSIPIKKTNNRSISLKFNLEL